MNPDQIEHQWLQFKDKRHRGKPDGDNLGIVNGQKNILTDKLQACYGYTKEEADREADKFGF